MTAVDTYRDALFGNPPAANSTPSREGSLAAFTELYNQAVVAAAAAVSGLTTLPDIAARDAFYSDADNQSKLVYVNNNNDAPDDPANGVYEYVDGSPRIAEGFYAGITVVVQPLVDQAEDAATEAAASAAFLSTIYGVIFSLPGFPLVMADPNGNIILQVQSDPDGGHSIFKAVLPLTFDSIVNQTIGEIPNVTRALLSANGNSYEWTLRDGSIFRPDTIDVPAPLAKVAQPEGRIANAMWSWWVSDLFLSIGDRRFVSCIGRSVSDQTGMGAIKVSQSVDRGAWETCVIGRQLSADTYWSDDHNVAGLLGDSRIDAVYPLMAFQTDHAEPGSTLRMWRSESDATGLSTESFVSSRGLYSYNQTIRRPDEPDHLYQVTRPSSSTSGTWRLRRSLDNGDSWTNSIILFDEPYTYTLIDVAADFSGLRIVAYRNPSSPDDSDVAYLNLDWDGELTKRDGTVVAADVWAANLSLDPFTDASIIYAPTGDLRLLDFKELTAGVLSLLWAEGGDIYYAEYDLSDGSLTSKAVCPSGDGVDPGDTLFYYAGAKIIGDYAIIAGRWDAGTTTGTISTFRGADLGGTAWTEAVIETGARKLFRPIVETVLAWDDGNSREVRSIGTGAFYLRGRGGAAADYGWTDFYHFDADAIEIDLEDY